MVAQNSPQQLKDEMSKRRKGAHIFMSSFVEWQCHSAALHNQNIPKIESPRW